MARDFRRTRIELCLICAVLLGGALMDGLLAQARSAGFAYGCWLLPDASVGFLSSFEPGCPLRPYERVRGLRQGDRILPIYRRAELVAATPADADVLHTQTLSEEGYREVPIAVRKTSARESLLAILIPAAFGLVLVALGFGLLWSSTSPAAAPLLLICTTGAMGLLARGFHAGGANPDATLLATQAIAPTVLLHLALSLPTRSDALHRLRAGVPYAYAVAGAIVAFQLNALRREDPAWALGDYLVLCILGAAVLVFASTSRAGLERASSGRERAQTLSLLAMLSVVALVGAVVPMVTGPGVDAELRRFVTAALLGLLGVAGYVACRWAVVGLPSALRSVVGYTLDTVLVASALSWIVLLGRGRIDGELLFEDPSILLGGCFAALLGINALQRVTRAVLPRGIGASRLERVRAAHAQEVAAIAHPDAAATALLRAVSDGLRAPGAAVFFPMDGGGFRLAGASGEPSLRGDLAGHAARLMEASAPTSGAFGSARVRPVDPASESDEALLAAGIGASCSLGTAERQQGVLLLTGQPAAQSLTGEELHFLDGVCAQTALALDNARLQDEAARAARLASASQVGAGLAHDLGRPLGEIFVEARSLQDSLTDEPATRKGLGTIAALADECLTLLERLGTPASSPLGVHPGGERLGHVVGSAIERVARLNGGRRPVLRLASEDPLVSDAKDLQRVVENLLENAFRWAGPGATVEVLSRTSGAWVHLEVIDDGVGMDRATLGRAQDPFFSARGGSGLGLAVCRDVIDKLGGEFEIESRLRQGTRVRLSVPVRAGSAA